jgi:hypothetical protein
VKNGVDPDSDVSRNIKREIVPHKCITERYLGGRIWNQTDTTTVTSFYENPNPSDTSPLHKGCCLHLLWTYDGVHTK